jgi:hypothetical protein
MDHSEQADGGYWKNFLVSKKTLVLFLAFYPIAVLLPLVAYKLNLDLAGTSRGRAYQLFEFFSFFVSLLILALAFFEARKKDLSQKASWVPLFLLVAAGFYFLMVLADAFFKSGDYLCFERAGRSLLSGFNPYYQTKYEYPPLMAQTLSWLFQFFYLGADLLKMPMSEWGTWLLIFYLYQTIQYILLLTVFFLLRRLALGIGLKEPLATLVVAGLCVFNVPLYRTLLYNQTNLWILNILLFALLFVDRRPILSGIFLAFGTLLKLYPILFLFPWMLLRKTKAFVYFLLGLVGIAALQTRFFTDLTLYQKYLSFFLNDYPRYAQFRNNCFLSLISNVMNFIRWHIVRIETHTLEVLVAGLTAFVIGLVMAWFAIRALKRERAYRALTLHPLDPSRAASLSAVRALGHTLDMLPLMLLAAPTLWEHHFTLVMPFVLWAIPQIPKRRMPLFGLIAAMIFAVPVFDLFPFSYHRIAGLLLLVLLVPPDHFHGPAGPLLDRE